MYADVGSDVEGAAVWVERRIERLRCLGLLEPAGQPRAIHDGRPRLRVTWRRANTRNQPPPMGGQAKRPPLQASNEGGLAWRTLTSGSPASGRSTVGSEVLQQPVVPRSKGANAAGPSPAQAVCTTTRIRPTMWELHQVEIVSSWRCERTSGPADPLQCCAGPNYPRGGYLAC